MKWELLHDANTEEIYDFQPLLSFPYNPPGAGHFPKFSMQSYESHAIEQGRAAGLMENLHPCG